MQTVHGGWLVVFVLAMAVLSAAVSWQATRWAARHRPPYHRRQARQHGEPRQPKADAESRRLARALTRLRTQLDPYLTNPPSWAGWDDADPDPEDDDGEAEESEPRARVRWLSFQERDQLGGDGYTNATRSAWN